MPPDAPLAAFVRRLQRRAAIRGLAEAAAWAGLSGVVALGVLRLARVSSSATAAVVLSATAIAAVVVVLAARRRSWGATEVVARAETAQPAFRNQLVTAMELDSGAARTSARMGELVTRRAADVARRADVRQIVPLGRMVVLGLVGLLALTATLAVGLSPGAGIDLGRTVARLAGERPAGPVRIERVDVRTVPPAYAQRTSGEARDPVRVDVLAGTELELRIHTAGALDVRLDDRPLAVERTSGPPDPAVAAVTAHRSGAIVVSAADGSGTIRDRRVIALVVSDDEPPRVVFEKPASDLVLADAGQPVTFVARASDDLALTTLTLRYTKVSGSGERFEFDEGSIPWQVTRNAAGEWRATTTQSPAAFGIREGDLLVYHASATDSRPGRTAAISDAFVIEIGRPQAAIAGGFAIPPDEERSAISLSALIRKTETLHDRRGTLAAGAFAEQAAGLAIEQRMVRTETLFMMGSHGHVEDEEVEAAHSHEIQEGRLENQGHSELLTAIRLMTRAEQRLLASDTAGALLVQRRALTALQRALGRQRYFLRTTPVRSRIDPGRRGSGDLSAARSWSIAPAPVDTTRARRARVLLEEAETLSRPGLRPADPALAGFAARLLSLDPASEAPRGAAVALVQADTDAERDAAWRAVVGLLDAVAAPAPAMPATQPSAGRLSGAFVGALREAGSARP